MPTDTSFSSGFASGAGAITDRNALRLQQEQNQQEQQNLLRERADASVKDALTKLGESSAKMSAQYFTSKGVNDQKGMNEAIAVQTEHAKALWASTEQLMDRMDYSDAEKANIRQQFKISASLNNPAAEQKLIAAGEAEAKVQPAIDKAAGVSDATQANKLERIRVTAEEARATRAVPTSNTEIQMTQGGAASQPPGQEPFEGIGVSIMEDIRQSSGAFAAASKAVSRTIGQAVEGTNPRLDAEQRVRNFNQDFKNTLTRNPKYPVAELKAISANLLPDPSAIMTDPEAEARKIPLLKRHLENLNEVDARTLQGNLSKKGRNDTIDRMASRQSGIDLIGDVPDISVATEARVEELISRGIDDLTDEEVDELNELLP